MINNIKAYFSCKYYTEVCSKRRDLPLTSGEKLKYWFHHCICFTCRRFAKHLDFLETTYRGFLGEKNNNSFGLTASAKERIAGALKEEINSH